MAKVQAELQHGWENLYRLIDPVGGTVFKLGTCFDRLLVDPSLVSARSE